MSKEVKVKERLSFAQHSYHATSRFVTQVGIIGGTGLDNPDLLEERAEKEVSTPFGKASANSIHFVFFMYMYTRQGRKLPILVTELQTNECVGLEFGYQYRKLEKLRPE